MNLWLVLTENSVAFGGLLFLLSAGFSLIFGLMRIPNLTHGSLFTLGAYFGTSLIAAAFGFWPAAIATGTGSPPGALSRTLPQQGAGLPTGSDPTEFAGLDTPAVLAADGNGSVTARSNGSGCTSAGRTSRCYVAGRSGEPARNRRRGREGLSGWFLYWSILKTVNHKARMCDR